MSEKAESERKEKFLAKLSEESNYEIKNRFRFKKNTMNYADKRRMPVDDHKLVDMLRNQAEFRYRVNKEVPVYDPSQLATGFQNALLSYANEVSWGSFRDLLRDVGIRADNLIFYNAPDF